MFIGIKKCRSFHQILDHPYAYVLGVSDKWIEKFEDIVMPDDTTIYISTTINSRYFMHCCIKDLHSHNISTTRAYRASHSHSNGGFSGGCGGFSGGGSGGGGGSSW